MFCFEICTPEGRGGEKGGNANFKTKHTEPWTQEIPSAQALLAILSLVISNFVHCSIGVFGGGGGRSAGYFFPSAISSI